MNKTIQNRRIGEIKGNKMKVKIGKCTTKAFLPKWSGWNSISNSELATIQFMTTFYTFCVYSGTKEHEHDIKREGLIEYARKRKEKESRARQIEIDREEIEEENWRGENWWKRWWCSHFYYSLRSLFIMQCFTLLCTHLLFRFGFLYPPPSPSFYRISIIIFLCYSSLPAIQIDNIDVVCVDINYNRVHIF